MTSGSGAPERVTYAPGKPFRTGRDECSWYTSCPATLVPEELFPIYLGFGPCRFANPRLAA